MQSMLNSSALSAASGSVYISVRTPNTVGWSVVTTQSRKSHGLSVSDAKSKRSYSLNRTGKNKAKRKLNLFRTKANNSVNSPQPNTTVDHGSPLPYPHLAAFLNW